jgi:hypothetical protein
LYRIEFLINCQNATNSIKIFILTQTCLPRLARMTGVGRKGAKLLLLLFFLGVLCGLA